MNPVTTLKERALPMTTLIAGLLLVFYLAALQPLAGDVTLRENQLIVAREKKLEVRKRWLEMDGKRSRMEEDLRRMLAVSARQTAPETENQLVDLVGAALSETGIRFSELLLRREQERDLGEHRLHMEMDFSATEDALLNFFSLLRQGGFFVLPEEFRWQVGVDGAWNGRLRLLVIFRGEK